MKITIIAPFAFGYTAHIHKALNAYKHIDTSILYLDKPGFIYKNSWHKVRNFVSKIFGKNLKKSFVFDRIQAEMSALGNQDIVFIIRPDLLDDKTLSLLKQATNEFIAYYYDSTRRFPRKADIINCFDKIYSYDKQDVENYGFEFLTNYIFDEQPTSPHEYQFFNISTNDHRFGLIENLAAYLKARKWTYNIQVFNGSPMPAEHVQIITKFQSIAQVAEMIKKTKIIVEIQRSDQIGLSFRIFEALGYRKKLITTNTDIVNYDFYKPQNILVIDEHNIDIPEEFVSSPYEDLAPEILDKYRIKNWVKPIFNLE